MKAEAAPRCDFLPRRESNKRHGQRHVESKNPLGGTRPECRFHPSTAGSRLRRVCKLSGGIAASRLSAETEIRSRRDQAIPPDKLDLPGFEFTAQTHFANNR